MITFRKITRDNYDKVAELHPGEENLKYIPPNWMIMLSAHYMTNCLEMKAIYNNGTLIGFFMLSSEIRPIYIEYFMIDKKYQNQGLGNLCIEKLIKYIKNNYIVNSIYISTSNPIAFNLYKKYDFKKLTNKMADKYANRYNEFLLIYTFKKI